MAAFARRVPRRSHDGGPARAPVGQPARAAGSTASGASTSTCAASISRPTATASRCTATCAARRSRSHADVDDRRRLRRAARLRRAPRHARGVPVPARRRPSTPASTSAGCGSRPRSSRPDADRGADLVLLAPVSAAARRCAAQRLGAALAAVRARRCRRAHHPDRRARRRNRPSAHRSDAARSTITTRSAPTDASRSRPAGARCDLTLRGRRIRSGSCTCRRGGNFAAIEPMTATIDALGTRHDADASRRRPVPRVVHDRRAARDAAAPAAAGRVHRVPRRPLRARRSLLGESRAGRARRHVVSRPRRLVASARSGYRSRRVPHATSRDPLRRGAVHGRRVPPAGSRERRPAARCRREERMVDEAAADVVEHIERGIGRRRALHGRSRPDRNRARRRARAARPRARRRHRLSAPRSQSVAGGGAGRSRTWQADTVPRHDARGHPSIRSTAAMPGAEPKKSAVPNEYTEPLAPRR